jgi:two-component system, chemotaxis family, chemotaxis protein CheY
MRSFVCGIASSYLFWNWRKIYSILSVLQTLVYTIGIETAMRVLLVEDAQGMRKLISTMLQGMGFKDVLEAEDGSEAWKQLEKYDVDMVLTDWNMPVMDGLELVKKIRSSSNFSEVPILMFTARATKEDVVRALQSGIDTYITKPFTPPQLGVKIKSMLLRRARQHLNQIMKNIDPVNREDEHPLILFGETAATVDTLNQPDNKGIADFLAGATSAVMRVDERTPDYKIGYALSDDTTALNKHMHLAKIRVKMLIISSQLSGGGVTLARLASINNFGSMGIFVVCESMSELTPKDRFGLERLDVAVFERHRMHGEDFEQLVTETVVAAMSQDGPVELPSPEEIRKRIENDIRNMVDLPVLPQVYHAVIALDKDPESDIHGWASAVATDPLSQAQVIRRSRSPIYGFQGEINDLGKAVVLLGKNTVKELVVSSAVKRSFEGIQDEGFSVEDYWLHSVGVSIAARILAFSYDEKRWTPQHKKDFEEFQLSEEAHAALKEAKLWEAFALTPDQDPFVGGMMHDIGKVALIQAYPGLFPMIVEELQNQSWNLPMKVGEDLLAGGADHNLVGRILADSWKLGSELAQIVDYHHTPSADDFFSQLISLSDFVGGCVYPYPKQATYPMMRMLADEGIVAVESAPGHSAADAAPATKEDAGEKSADGETPAEGQAAEESEKPPAPKEPGPASVLTPGEAIYNFLPANTLKTCGGDINVLIRLARLIQPTIRRMGDELRKGS